MTQVVVHLHDEAVHPLHAPVEPELLARLPPLTEERVGAATHVGRRVHLRSVQRVEEVHLHPKRALRKMLIAGAPLDEAVQRAGAPLASGTLGDGGLAALMSRHAEVFPPSVIALVQRAEYAGDLARTLELIAQEVLGR